MIALLEHEEEIKEEIPKTIGCQVMYTSLLELIFENVKFHLGKCDEMYKSLYCPFEEEENDE